MSGQDHNPVVFSKSSRPQSGAQGMAQAQRAGQVQAAPRQPPGSASTSSGISAAQLENETDELKHAQVPKELKQAIQKARMAKGLTQKQLAQQLNMQPQTINEYENGKAIPQNAEIAKIERALGVKLPRVKKK
eukprot:CAMPEP_0119398258 /NCGR_PEP_ID=MMETSP1334-20130426/140751_1 /TAXON_ID=127549 /ORGANISM="Calcidiscus leptoporus, Strain RCC1130" /LENGTH=132 /DNA_ID=CAMNT_0007422115 /DNA_START=911 /DNA_END=1309 /DNA_ORIENTATION=+